MSFDAKQYCHGLLALRDSPESLSRCWSTIIGYYSACNLTEETDILPDISGVARQLLKSALGEYVAGLWREDLLASLLWTPSAS